MGWQDMFPRDTAAKNERGAIHPCFNQMPKSAESSPKLFARSSQEALTLDKFLATGWGRTARIETSSNFFPRVSTKPLFGPRHGIKEPFSNQSKEGQVERQCWLGTVKQRNTITKRDMQTCLFVFEFLLLYPLLSALLWNLFLTVYHKSAWPFNVAAVSLWDVYSRF